MSPDELKQLRDQVAAREPLAMFYEMPPPYPYQVDPLLRRQAEKLAALVYDGEQKFSAPSSPRKEDLIKVDFGGVRSDAFRKQWRTPELYIAWMWPFYVERAREVLATVLRPEFNQPQHVKDEIYDALTAPYDENISQVMVREHLRRQQWPANQPAIH